MQIEYFADATPDAPYRFRVRDTATNEIVHESDGYTSKSNARRAAQKLYPKAGEVEQW